MKKHEHIVETVEKDSIARELGIEPGDRLISINGQEIEDIFDYQYYVEDEELLLLIEKPDGEQWELEIEKDADESLGIGFGAGLMDEYRSCCNRCIFCFIDQMPPGMRDTLYFKDDDTRLSFLQGNYVTLTNISEEDMSRIISYHLAPINISVHTTNPQLRCEMLHNRFAGDILDKIRMLYDAGIEMNAQIVLCKGINDGEELERTIGDLLEFYPFMQSLSVVPVGLTKYREGLYPLKPFAADDAGEVLEIIRKWQEISQKKNGVRFVQASDEWYLLAGEPLPEAGTYDGYLQLENGVGMLRLLMDEFDEALEKKHHRPFMRKREISLATGYLAAPFIREMCARLEKKFPRVTTHVYAIRNDFFGEKITVSGLITGQDLIAQLQGKVLGERLLLPQNMLRCGEEVFLDDVTLTELKKSLQVQVDIVKSSGQDFVDAVLGLQREEPETAEYEPYELKELYKEWEIEEE